jgi:hypothetical protein
MKTSTLSFGKYLVLSVLALGMTISSCKKEEEEVIEPKTGTTAPEPTFSAHAQVQVPIVLKETGELCPPCGGWGWTNWEILKMITNPLLLNGQITVITLCLIHFL